MLFFVFFENKKQLQRRRLRNSPQNKKCFFQPSVIDQTTFLFFLLSLPDTSTRCVSVSNSLNCIYYLQTVSILKFPPRGHVLTQSRSMDPGSGVNELLLQSKGTIMCEPSGRFHVVYLSLLWRRVLPRCPSTAVSLFSSSSFSAINIPPPHPPSTLSPCI